MENKCTNLACELGRTSRGFTFEQKIEKLLRGLHSDANLGHNDAIHFFNPSDIKWSSGTWRTLWFNQLDVNCDAARIVAYLKNEGFRVEWRSITGDYPSIKILW